MKLGIDFGTTRIVVARADRGNYPVVTFESPDGEARDFIPALIASSASEIRYGWAAWEVSGQPGWTLTRSIKRLLETAGPTTQVNLGPLQIPVLELLKGLAATIRDGLSPLDEQLEIQMEAMIGVPANSNSNQRYLTAEAFRCAGFSVLGVQNEPSAAGIEYAHSITRKKQNEELLLIYDLGGGTFDASLVDLKQSGPEVLASEGISTLGGDDFDALLVEAVLPAGNLETLNQHEQFLLLDISREAKESLHANSRKILLDLDLVQPGMGTVTIPVSEYFERARPLVDETIHAVNDLLLHVGSRTPDCLYITGGGSELPLISRMLREGFGRRVKRSAYTRAATAIGLAISADGHADGMIQERFTRFFGVWREADEGQNIIFDPVFAKGTALPSAGELPLHREREYTPTHNIGHFRYLEASTLYVDGRPGGDLTLWDEILFPFDPALEGVEDLRNISVEHSEHARQQKIAEIWLCHSNGSVEVVLSNRTSGYEKRFKLGRWNSATPVVRPMNGKRRKSNI